MKNLNINFLKAVILLVTVVAAGMQVQAQLNPMGALYFQNQYLGNPAMAGMDGLNVNLGYRKQWSSIPGSPSTQTLTADYQMTPRAGIGLNLYNDQAGLIKRTRTVGNYAYHLPLNAKGNTLSMGLSLGFMNERISYEDISGDQDDLSVGNFNQRETYIDGDFGMAFSSKKLTIQAALPNLKDFFMTDEMSGSVDRSTFFSAVSYKIQTGSATGFDIEPKLVFRGIKGFNNIIDIGANLSYAGDRLHLFGMYHSSKSATFGMGMNYQSLGFGGIYTTATSALSGYTSGNFEISLKARIFK